MLCATVSREAVVAVVAVAVIAVCQAVHLAKRRLQTLFPRAERELCSRPFLASSLYTHSSGVSHRVRQSSYTESGVP